MDEQRLAEIATRVAAATPAPWYAVNQHIQQGAPYPDGETLLAGGNAHSDDDYTTFTVEDCAFIAHARTDVVALILEVIRLRNILLMKTDLRPGADY